VSNVPTLQLFKEFAINLQIADHMLAFLPYEASKQHYSSINTLKQIQILNAQKLHTFLHYSLSGYFHTGSALPFNDLISHAKVAEWLHVYRYHIKLCPSQHEEILPSGALCYSNVFMHRGGGSNQAIVKHTSWLDSDSSFISEIYISDFLSRGKKTKMLLISSKKSKCEQTTKFFKEPI